MRPSIVLSGQRDWTVLLGAVIEGGDRFFSRFEEYVSVTFAKHLFLTLFKEFEYDQTIVLDRTLSFQALAVMDLAARNDLTFVTLPAYSSERNPVEENWRQLQAVLSTFFFFESLDDFMTASDTAVDQITVP